MNKPIHTHRARLARRAPPRGFASDVVLAGMARLPHLSPGLFHTLGRPDSSLSDKVPLVPVTVDTPPVTHSWLSNSAGSGMRSPGRWKSERDVGSPKLNDEWPAAAWEPHG